jgi:hypothetical protein
MILTNLSGLVLLPPLPGDSTLAGIVVVNVVANVAVIVALSAVAIVVSDVIVLLLVAATALHLHVVETILPARMIVAATATVANVSVTETTMSVVALVALSIASASAKTEIVETKIAKLPPMATTAKVRLIQSKKLLPSTPTTSSCPGTCADSSASAADSPPPAHDELDTAE